LTYASPRDLGATWFVCLDYGNAIRKVPTYEEGDIWITSDPYSGFVCTHAPDVHLWKPIFYKGEIVSFAVGHIHNTDVGGAVPASLSRTLTEVHQEGIRVPVVRLADRNGLNGDVLSMMWTNVRVPEQNWGDLKAQIAALHTGERKVLEMIEKFGIETFREGMAGVLDYAEQQARQVVRSMPDGVYSFADYIDEDSAGGKPCRIALKATVAGDTLDLDFSGSDPQLHSSLNLPTGGNARHALIMVGLTYVLYAVNKQILLNSGLARVVTGTLPVGSCVNPVFPAAVGMRSLMCKRVQGLIMGTFAQVLPDLMPADPSSGGPMVNVNAVDARTGSRVVVCINPMPGGAGGSLAGRNLGARGSRPHHPLRTGRRHRGRRCPSRRLGQSARVQGVLARHPHYRAQPRSYPLYRLGAQGRPPRRQLRVHPQPRLQQAGRPRQHRYRVARTWRRNTCHLRRRRRLRPSG
jgi:N-methylhydantoinase B